MLDVNDDQDLDDGAKYYTPGPGRRTSTPGPVDAAYADADMDHPCEGCGSPAHQFCRHRNGVFRKVPCSTRISSKKIQEDESV